MTTVVIPHLVHATLLVFLGVTFGVVIALAVPGFLIYKIRKKPVTAIEEVPFVIKAC